jgi:pilus assembly protein CpaD
VQPPEPPPARASKQREGQDDPSHRTGKEGSCNQGVSPPSLSAAGPPGLAAARQAAIARALLPYRIVAQPAAYPWVARDHATITVDRTLVTLPPCPNWSGPTPEHFDNWPASNFTCATTVNLGQMVASPTDLRGGEPLGPADAAPAVIATDLYLTNKVPPPVAAGGISGAASFPSAGAGVSAGGP